MALSLQASNLAWQKVKIALADASPFVQEQFKDLKSFLAQTKGNPDLQFVAINDLTTDFVVADVATTVYGIYLKKRNTATDAFFKADDSATVTSGTADMIVQELDVAKEVVTFAYPEGYAQANGFTVASDTTANGVTSSTAGDGPDGFVLIGAA